jgi:NAD(P)-dependent dehydrogenase (short-subunit alcohol dehydrogenase family)
VGTALEGRVVIVTGASRGIGAEIARRFAAEGAAVAAAARTVEPGPKRLPGTITETAEAIRANGGRAVAVPVDLSRPADRERLVTETERELGPVDILVSNAAVTYFTPALEFDLRRYDLMFEVQVKAALHLAQLLVPGMRERGRGWVLNVSSGAARHPQIPPSGRAGSGAGTVYGMCKAALERLSTGLAAEVFDAGIAVNALSPSRVVPTPGTIFHGLTTEGSPDSEPPAVMAAAALALCGGHEPMLTGRIAYSQDLLRELGLPIPTA